ncbi:MAG TPA: hypothetical protein VEA92_02130 [Candidatus Paceibacterota bacterium]|nr:hypothetical protein [Candidatus Paceibacterota bacterium]
MRRHHDYDAAIMQYPNLYALLRKVRELYITHGEIVIAAKAPVLMGLDGVPAGGSGQHVKLCSPTLLDDDEHTLGQELQCIAWMGHCGELSREELKSLDKDSEQVLRSITKLSRQFDSMYARRLRRRGLLN